MLLLAGCHVLGSCPCWRERLVSTSLTVADESLTAGGERQATGLSLPLTESLAATQTLPHLLCFQCRLSCHLEFSLSGCEGISDCYQFWPHADLVSSGCACEVHTLELASTNPQGRQHRHEPEDLEQRLAWSSLCDLSDSEPDLEPLEPPIVRTELLQLALPLLRPGRIPRVDCNDCASPSINSVAACSGW